MGCWLFRYLFSLESEFNEDLLKFLIHEIDAKLLETILLEDLETIDVQDAKVQHIIALSLHFHGLVGSL